MHQNLHPTWSLYTRLSFRNNSRVNLVGWRSDQINSSTNNIELFFLWFSHSSDILSFKECLKDFGSTETLDNKVLFQVWWWFPVFEVHSCELKCEVTWVWIPFAPRILSLMQYWKASDVRWICYFKNNPEKDILSSHTLHDPLTMLSQMLKEQAQTSKHNDSWTRIQLFCTSFLCLFPQLQ